MLKRNWIVVGCTVCLLLAGWGCAGNPTDPDPVDPTESPLTFVEHVIDSAFSQTMSVAVADFNQDRIPDVAGASYGGNTIAWWKKNSSQGFDKSIVSADFAGVRTVTDIDFDQDGDLDILAAAFLGNAVGWWENDSAGNFTSHPVAAGFNGAHSALAADLDGDGDLDIVGSAWTDTGTSSISWWENDGSNLNFFEKVLWPTPANVACIAIVDIDRDSDLDIMATVDGGGDGRIILFQNGGACNFTPLPVIGNFLSVHWLDVGDLDRDGDMDIAGGSCGSVVAWWENIGNLNFQKHSLSPSLACVSMVVLTDLDQDGNLDIVASAETSNCIVWWRNGGQKEFSSFEIISSFRGASGIDVNDMDGDGDLDIVATARYANKISWWENRKANP